MDDALAMRLVERVGDLAGDLQRLVERERPFLEPRGQRLALEMRHDQIVRAVTLADVVDAADVGMIQGGDRAGLALETRPQIGIIGDLTGQHPDGNRSIEARVAGFVNFAHSARTECAQNLIRPSRGLVTWDHDASRPIVSIQSEAPPPPLL
jgi:hypothetical protein